MTDNWDRHTAHSLSTVGWNRAICWMLNLRCGTTGRCVRLSKFEGGRGLSPWVVYTACDPISLVEIFPNMEKKRPFCAALGRSEPAVWKFAFYLGNHVFSTLDSLDFLQATRCFRVRQLPHAWPIPATNGKKKWDQNNETYWTTEPQGPQAEQRKCRTHPP